MKKKCYTKMRNFQKILYFCLFAYFYKQIIQISVILVKYNLTNRCSTLLNLHFFDRAGNNSGILLFRG